MKVFLVDDEIIIREGIRDSFPWEDTSYILAGEAPDGEMALPMIRDTNPDIVITDIRMPFMDGLELCRQLRSRMPWIGIIILSGYDEFEYARQCMQLGVREYLLKPISAEDLRKALDRVSGQLEEERNSRARAESLIQRIETGGRFLKEKLISTLFSDESTEADAEGVLRQLRALGVPVTAPCYTVLDAAFEPIREGQEAAMELAESSGGIAYAAGGRVGTRVLILGDNSEDAEERAYAFAVSLTRKLERIGCIRIRVGVGEIVRTPGEILRSFKSARHIRHILADRQEEEALIIGTREVGEMPGEGKSLTVVNEAKYYLSRHFADPNLMLQDVARAVGMSSSRFSTVFSQQSGKTFTEYLTFLRLNRAKELLRETDMKSSQIATEAGYSDAHYFSYLFKKHEGITPGEYRAQKENQPE
ncbi:MAG: response regulator [Clostridiales bacterium]|nr:response regulator [Clostridiales bacterium]